MNVRRVPAYLNPLAGSAVRMRAALARDARIELCEVAPPDIAGALRAEIARGTSRLVVCGGDGTLAAALGAAAGTDVSVGVLPGGTLNHFARDCGIPLDDPVAALDIALNGSARPLDLGYVNGRPMLNTSAVGIYVDFVRRREQLEHRLRYRPASVGAALAVWKHPRAFSVELQTAGDTRRRLTTPLVFVGVQERLFARGAPGTLGMRRSGGARALHILVVKEDTPLRIRSLIFRAVVRGIDGLIRDEEIASYLTTRAVVRGAGKTGTIAVDGELVEVTWPLTYELAPSAVMVVRP